MARRAPTVDPLLTKLRAEVAARLARNPRVHPLRRARLVVNELTIDGLIIDVAMAAVFLRADVLTEAGERGVLSVGRMRVPVRASFSRTASADEEAGMILAFEPADGEGEVRVLELLLDLIESTT